MISARRTVNQTTSSAPHLLACAFTLALSAALFTSAASGQQASSQPDNALLAANTMPNALPDAPGMASAAPDSSSSATGAALPDAYSPQATVTIASHTDKYIAPGESAPRIDFKDKFVLGFKDAFSPLSAIGWVVSAGYEQATDGSPNYGSDITGFGKRVGAAALRSSSEGVFSDSIMSPIFHEDPRYYRLGPGHNFFKRTAYSVTRTLITRTDSGRETVNLGLLTGNLGGAYLTKAYYPDLNTTTPEIFKTFAGSVGGSALGFFVSEFFSGGLNIFHNSKPTQN